ncbi:hypothetical protein SprV_0802574900 [Sparganum proliferum]
MQCTSLTTLPAAFPTVSASNPTAYTATTALSSEVQHPCAPPPSVTPTFNTTATIPAASTVTNTAPTPATEQNPPGGQPITIFIPSGEHSVPTCIHCHCTFTSRIGMTGQL